MTGILDVRHLNAYVANKTPERAAQQTLRPWPGAPIDLDARPHFASFNEATRVLPLLPGRSNYRLHRAVGVAPDQDRETSDVAVVVRRDLRMRGQYAHKVSDEVEPTKIAPSRWLLAVAAEVPDVGVVGFVSLHLNAAVMGRRGRRPHVQEYAKSVQRLDAFLTWFSLTCDHVVVAGDVNYRPHYADPWSPYPVLERHGLALVARANVDVVAASAGLRLAEPMQFIDKSLTGSDAHQGLRVRLITT